MLYALLLGPYPFGEVNLVALAANPALVGKITGISLLGSQEKLKYNRTTFGLQVTLPPIPVSNYAHALKITGLKMNPPAETRDGNPR